MKYDNLRKKVMHLALGLAAVAMIVFGLLCYAAKEGSFFSERIIASQTEIQLISASPIWLVSRLNQGASFMPESLYSPINAATGSATTKDTEEKPTVIGTQIAVSFDYTKNQVTLKAGSGGSTRFFISTNNKKTWDVIDNPSATPLLDITTYMKSSKRVLYFRGNKDIAPVEFTIPKLETNLVIKYEIKNAMGSISFNDSTNLEYRLEKDQQWKDYVDGAIVTKLYEDTGISIDFRKKATVSERAGKIVKVKIKKRPNAPSIKLDFSKMVVSGLKAEQTLYRVNGMNDTAFTKFSPTDKKQKTLELSMLLGQTAGSTQPLPAATLEFRIAGDEKKLPSAIRFLEIKAQPVAPATASLSGSTLTISDASKEKPYEYTVLQATEVFDYSKIKWKSVKNSKPIIIKKSGSATTIPGDIIYVRLATVTEKETGLIVPPSLLQKLVIQTISGK